MKKVLIALLILVLGFWIFSKVTIDRAYPDIVTPKDVMNSGADVNIEVFSDIECPACKKAHPVIERIAEEYNASVTFYHYPLTFMHDYAMKAAEGAECANDQGKFWEFLDLAYASSDLSKKSLVSFASDLDMDVNSFENCLLSSAKKAVVKDDMKEGDKRDVKGTPTIYINGKQLSSWRYDFFKNKVIEAGLQ